MKNLQIVFYITNHNKIRDKKNVSGIVQQRQTSDHQQMY